KRPSIHSRAPLFKDFPFLLFQGLHGDGAGRAPIGAETAADAFIFVLDDGACLASLEFSRGHSIAILNQCVVAFVSAHLHKVHQAQAVLRAYVHTTVAQDALRSVEDRVHLAIQAAKPFRVPLFLVKAKFHLGDPDPAVGGEHRHLLPWDAEKATRRYLNAVVATQEREVGLLADGEAHASAGNDLFLVAEDRIEAAILIEDGEAA